jgi:hypothetical protein
MSKRKTERLVEGVRRMGEQLGENDANLNLEEVRKELRESGIDLDEARARFHRTAKKIAERERLADRTVPLSLKQAIDATRPDDEMPHDSSMASAFAERWIDKFRSCFVLPTNIEVARAYRKSGDLLDSDGQELDRLEKELKERVKKENGRNR